MSFENYAQYYELFNQDKPYKKEIEFVYKWAEKPKSILDIACGTANYWGYYPKKITLTGIEKSKDMIGLSKNSEMIFQLEASNIRELDFVSDFDLATCLFDAINYMPSHKWWMDIPVRPGGFFIFDIWDKEKVDKEGFRKTSKTLGNATREITPIQYDGKTVDLKVDVLGDKVSLREIHKMFIYSHDDIQRFCGDYFEIVETKSTKSWQKWYKLRKK